MIRYLSIILSLVSFVFSQEVTIPKFNWPDSVYRVSQIYYIGNEVTQVHIIEEEMSLKTGDLVTHESVQFDINRIYSLRLFTKVDIQVIPDSSETATLSVIVTERWYFYPFPVLGLKDRDFAKIYYGLGLAHNNVAGNNVQMYGAFGLGYDPFISFNYVNPRIDAENKLFFSFRSYYTEQRNRSLISLAGAPNFDENRSGIEMSLGKRYSLFTTLSMKLEYLNLSVSNNVIGRTLSPNGRDEYYSLHVAYNYDTRDLKEYASYGTYIGIGLSKFGLFEQEVNYQRVGIDIRRYIPVWSDIVFAGRIFGNLAGGGRIPNYGHTFFGYSERIRGYFDTVLEGEQIAGATFEAHLPILSPRYVTFDFIPIDQFKDVRYAMNIALFADAGRTWYRNEPSPLRSVYSGYGAGIHLLLAYSFVGRIEFAVPYGKPFSQGEIILDLGAAL